ncbi:unnamed protein product [Sphagnum balticum]
MKLHYSSESATNSRYRKIKSVANALKIELQEVAHDANVDLTTLSVFNTLPLLETPHGTFFSSNTIVRFLAGSAQNALYGADLHQRALVDQWLDITTCDLEAAVAAVVIARDGREVDTATILQDIHKFLNFVENHLDGRKFLVGESVSIADYSLATSLSVVLNTLGEEERTAYPESSPGTCLWWRLMPPPLRRGRPSSCCPKPKAAAVKKEKAKVVAKSILVFDVKVYEAEQDLEALAVKIRSEITLDGLVWSGEHKILPVAYGVNKLQIGCVIEDDKILTDDIFDKILAWEEEVQSVDTVSFQKL